MNNIQYTEIYDTDSDDEENNFGLDYDFIYYNYYLSYDFENYSSETFSSIASNLLLDSDSDSEIFSSSIISNE